MIQLYYTSNSPYARIARVAIIDAGLAEKTEFIPAHTRDTKTEFFQITPLARVPTLIHGDRLIADTRDICHYIDSLIDTPRWFTPETPVAQTQRHIATGLLDGIAVWLRENARPSETKSRAVLDYESHRVSEILPWLEQHFDQIFTPSDRWDFTTLTLTAALDIAQSRGMPEAQSANTPRLMDWLRDAALRPSMRQTTPV